MDSFVGEIRIFGFNYAPQDWAFCNGATLPVQQNPALFSILGTTFGGDGQSTFGLPNMQSRAPLAVDLSNNGKIGTATGTESVTLTANQIPAHNHSFNVSVALPLNTTTRPLYKSTPSATDSLSIMFSATEQLPSYNTSTPPNASLQSSAVGFAGGIAGGAATAHENRQPFLPMNFCISLAGTYPVRP